MTSMFERAKDCEYSDQGVDFPWILAEQCVLLKRGLEEVGQIRLEVRGVCIASLSEDSVSTTSKDSYHRR